MTNMFKKTLLASALVAAGSANAATLAVLTAADEVTSQYLASTVASVPAATVTANHVAPGFTVELGAEYAQDDEITITFTAPLAVALKSSITVAADAANDLKGITLGLLSGGAVGDSTVTYRVTSVVGPSDDSTIGIEFDIETGVAGTGIEFKKSALSSGVKASFAAKTGNGVNMDTAGGAARTAELVKVVKQFDLEAPTFARVVDVESQRLSFTDADDGVGTDYTVTGTFGIDQLAGGASVYVRPTAAITHTVTGNFGWVVDTAPNTDDIQPETGVFTIDCDGTAGGAVAPTAVTYKADSVVFTCAAVNDEVTFKIDPEANKANLEEDEYPVLPIQDLTVTSEVTYTTPADKEKLFNATAAGSWTLNGSLVQIPYMPYGTGITQVINLNNSGKQSGDITVEGFDRTGKAFGPVVVGQATPGKQVALADAIAAAVTTAVGTTERVSLTLVTNVPADDVTVYSAYNTGGNGARLVVNTSNGK